LIDRALLDTQVLVKAYLGEDLPKRVLSVLANPETERLISVTSVMEIAVKTAKGKLSMPEADVRQAIADLRLAILPFTARHAYHLFSLPEHHRDPFDRMLIATALVEGIPLIGSDGIFQRYRGLKVIW
jgi:PIN domain nuclease of toxin-antitoxin system